uniref:Uncharacterized protein n=1 Tax=Cannabis sativa TaxID=3483 RepID=A0A803QDD8_CANSA
MKERARETYRDFVHKRTTIWLFLNIGFHGKPDSEGVFSSSKRTESEALNLNPGGRGIKGMEFGMKGNVGIVGIFGMDGNEKNLVTFIISVGDNGEESYAARCMVDEGFFTSSNKPRDA